MNNVYNEISSNVNLDKIETSLRTLIQQGKKQVYELNGMTVIIDGNTRTIIKHLN